MSILWTIIIGFVAGVIAKFIMPGNRFEPTGFILTTILGIVGAVLATFIGQAVGWYGPNEGARFIGPSSAPAWCSRSTASSPAAPAAGPTDLIPAPPRGGAERSG